MSTLTIADLAKDAEREFGNTSFVRSVVEELIESGNSFYFARCYEAHHHRSAGCNRFSATMCYGVDLYST